MYHIVFIRPACQWSFRKKNDPCLCLLIMFWFVCLCLFLLPSLVCLCLGFVWFSGVVVMVLDLRLSSATLVKSFTYIASVIKQYNLVPV